MQRNALRPPLLRPSTTTVTTLASAARQQANAALPTLPVLERTTQPPGRSWVQLPLPLGGGRPTPVGNAG
jgi:hypothetical protein